MSAPVEVVEPALRPAPARAARGRVRPFVVVAAALIAAAAALPAVYLAVRGIGSDLIGTLGQVDVAWLVGRTVLLCSAVTASALAIALPMAWLTVRSDVPARRIWVVASSLPLVIPSFIGGYTFVSAFGPRGLLQGWLEPLGVERLPSIYGFGGAWLVLTLFTYPLALFPIRAAMATIDRSLDEASRALGRSRLETAVRVTLPQLRPAIVSGSLLVALYTLSDFGAVSLLRFRSITFEIFTIYRASFGAGRARAAAFGLVLVALTVLVLGAEVRTRGRGVHHAATARGSRPRPALTRLGAWRWPAFAACTFIVGLALVVPLGVIVIWLVRAVSSGVSFDVAVFPAVNSLRASAIGAAVTLVCAWPVAVVAARMRGRFARGIETASYIGYALPGLVIALSLVYFGTRVARPLYQTMAMLAFAYTVHFLPQATGTLRASIAQIHPSVEEAARSLGARPFTVLRRVTYPLVRPGAMTAFALVFLTVMKELPATLLLAPIGFTTLATQVWDKASAASFGQAAVPALLLVLLSSAPMAVLVAREHRSAVMRERPTT